MHTLNVALKYHNYPIYIGNHILGKKEVLLPHIAGQQIFIVTQKNIPHVYLSHLEDALADYQRDIFLLPEGEQYKNIDEWQKITTHLLQTKHERSTTLIALGGGVVGDMTGFAAACYQRGVNYIQVPTTLMAQVDSAIGGKTGINHPLAKNMLGAFYHPQCVIADINTLTTLPAREYVAGLAEVIKYGLICDAAFFNWLEKNCHLILVRDPRALLHVAAACAAHKAAIVAQDERDQNGLRQILNFGHTTGHALEAIGAYQTYLHGEAVALGMMAAVKLSVAVAGLTSNAVERVRYLLEAVGLPTDLPPKLKLADLIAMMKRDKKNHDGKIKLILLEEIGRAKGVDVTEERLRQLLRAV